ncbi:MAG TPA: nuclear transport factor 2 family protein [Phycisphaerales bacterium]
MTLSRAVAEDFARRWFSAWNAHDLPAILACYEPTIRHSSPFIKKYNDAIGKGDEPFITGLADLGGYFGRALERNKTLRFEPKDLAVGLESVILTYRRHSHDTPPEGELSMEVFFLKLGPDARARIERSVSHYG